LNENEKKSLFVEFNEESYGSLLDDIAHFVKVHDVDIERVQSEWTELYGFAKCSVSECAATERHHGGGRRDRKRERESEEEDALYAFYESAYDRMHHFIFHLYDLGLRVDAASLNLNQERDDEKEAESKGVTVDKLFAAEREHIMSRRKELNMDSERMSPQNTKFMIQTVNEHKGVTLTDALFEELTKTGNLEKDKIQQIDAFLQQNAFESDAVEMDLEEATESNIGPLIGNQAVCESMRKFIRTTNCMLSQKSLKN